MGGFKFWLGQAVGHKGVNHPAHATAIFFNEFKFPEDGGYLLVAQVRFVVAGFDLFNGQVVQQRAGVEEFDAVVKDFDGGVVGAAVVAVHDHIDDDFAQGIHGVVPAFFALGVAGNDVGFVGVLDHEVHDALHLLNQGVAAGNAVFDDGGAGKTPGFYGA